VEPTATFLNKASEGAKTMNCLTKHIKRSSQAFLFVIALSLIFMGPATQKAYSEMSEKGFSDWKPLFEKNGIKVFKGKLKGEAVIPFKAIGTLNGSLEEVVSVLLNFQQKPIWSPKLKSVKIHKETNSFVKTFSEYYETPWPSSDREFLLEGKMDIPDQNLVKLFASSSTKTSFSNKDHVLAQVNNLDLTLKRLTETKTAVEFVFMGDLKGWIPAWITNLIQRRWPYKFLKGLEKHINTKKLKNQPFPLPQDVKKRLTHNLKVTLNQEKI
tara:strand:+ start:3202 stop:4011 length:810 start_codon:yes stop_codon:yes gene_type:complete